MLLLFFISTVLCCVITYRLTGRPWVPLAVLCGLVSILAIVATVMNDAVNKIVEHLSACGIKPKPPQS